MARLHEYQGKAILAEAGLAVPRGHVAKSPDDAAQAAARLEGPCVVKIQAWTTGRAALGGVAFADTPSQAAEHARRMLQIKVGNFPVTELLIEERIAIARELFISLSIDDRERRPMLLISMMTSRRSMGGWRDYMGVSTALPLGRTLTRRRQPQ